MKIIILCTLAIAAVIAEPPVNNRYLPPQRLGGYTAPSQTYGPPGNAGFGQRQTDALFGSRPSSTYGAPSFNSRSRPSNQYGPPRTQSPTNQYLPPSQSNSLSSYRAPSSQYNAPSSQYGAPSSQYNAPSSQYNAPSSQYGAPSSQYSAPSSQYSAPSSQYGAPSSQYSAPTSQYGAPGIGGNQQYSKNAVASGFRGTDRAYLPPGRGGYAGDEDGNGEPANYSFEYMVKDEPSGNDFGHRESRQGDRAEGLYYVLLPDGRKQTVEYEADQNGYKPRISYEDTGLVGGYDRNAQSGYQDYQNQGGPY